MHADRVQEKATFYSAILTKKSIFKNKRARTSNPAGKKNPPGSHRVDFFATTLGSQRYFDCRATALPEKLKRPGLNRTLHRLSSSGDLDH
jgi:hypothetical protein